MTLARATRSLENPSLPLTSTALADWLGGSKSRAGTRVTEQRVFGLPAYYRAMAIRSGVEAALPLKVYRKGSKEPVTIRTVLDAPWAGQTPFGFRQTMKMNEMSWGNAYARKIRNGADIVVQALPVHPSRVRTVQVDITSDNPEGKLHLVTDRKGVEHRWTSWDILHVPFMSPDGITGVTALQAFRESLGTAIAGEDTAGSLMANGLRPSGMLLSKKKLQDPAVKRLKSQAKQKLAGPDNAGEVLVLDDDVTWQNVSIPPQDAQLLQSRQWSVSEIARMVGVMPHMIGDTERQTSWGTGIEQMFLGWVQTVLYPSTVNTEQIYTAGLLPGGWTSGAWYCEHVYEGLLRGDSAARAAFYAQAIQWGWLTRNEVRRLENREAAEGLDEFLTPSNMTLITIDGKAVPLTGDPNAQSQG